VVSFSESNAGLPTTNLGAVSYTALDFNSVYGTASHLVTVDFANFKIPIHTGSEYIVTYRSPFGVPTMNYDAPYYVGLVLDNPIPFGRVTTVAENGVDWRRSLPPIPPYTFELATRVWVTPEPPSFLMFISAFAIFIFASRRRDRRQGVVVACPGVNAGPRIGERRAVNGP
jgi:hypothetical protein